jgi:hypothetical protein
MKIIESKKECTDRIQGLASELLCHITKEEVTRAEALAALNITSLLIERMPCTVDET